tara:strand:+ start:457 stop:852 length:396 start_codon:yes stop_codon:yes gene_type:complete
VKDYKDVTHYTDRYDDLMNTELEIVKNVYNYDKDGAKQDDYLLYPKYSIKLPNKMTGLRMTSTMDGEQPCYENTAYLDMLEKYDIYHDMSIADYPRHGDTKRIFYKDLEKAQAALYYLKKHNNYINKKEVA